MQARILFSRALFVLALPFVLLGLIDPLEGGVSLALALVIYLAAFVLSKQKPIKLLWIPFVAAVLIGAGTIALAIANLDTSERGQGLPLQIIVAVWAYRLAVAVTMVGAVITVVRSFRTK
jgi:hypothetical protein